MTILVKPIANSKFLYDFSSVYEKAFPKLEIKIKQKTSIVPELLKEQWNLPNKIKNFVTNFFISRTKENEVIYKAY